MAYDDFASNFQRVSVTIAAGQSLSEAFTLKRAEYVTIVMPAAWTAADITFQVAYVPDPTAADWRNVWTLSGELIVPADANRVITVPASGVFPLLNPVGRTADGVQWPNVRLRSGTSATPVNQAAARTIIVLAR